MSTFKSDHYINISFRNKSIQLEKNIKITENGSYVIGLFELIWIFKLISITINWKIFKMIVGCKTINHSIQKLTNDIYILLSGHPIRIILIGLMILLTSIRVYFWQFPIYFHLIDMLPWDRYSNVLLNISLCKQK